jgi:hypothetical protein
MVLLFYPSLGAVDVALDPTCFLGVYHAETWQFIGRDVDPDILELTIWRCGSLRGTRGNTLLIDLLS